jgi:hypothetical protein
MDRGRSATGGARHHPVALKREPVVLYNDGRRSRVVLHRRFRKRRAGLRGETRAVGQVFSLGSPQGTITNLELTRLILRLAKSRRDHLQAASGRRDRVARAVDP